MMWSIMETKDLMSSHSLVVCPLHPQLSAFRLTYSSQSLSVSVASPASLALTFLIVLDGQGP